MGKICRRNSLFFFAGLLALCAIGAITYALLSEELVSCKIRRNVSNKTFDAGWKKFGLIRGCEEIQPFKFGGSARDKCFQVFKEFDNVFNLKILYAVIGCLVVGGIVLILSAGLSFYNEFTKSSYVILGSVGLYIFNGVAFFFMLCAVGLFSGLYHQQIKKNVLKSSEIDEGFNSEDNASLKFSFWILVGACFLPLINMLLTFLNSARAKSYFNKTTTIPTSNVDGMMLY
ncbi:Hypothetical predicted protein [Paramuricea clavata]|uniref:Uncharacterized protein n=1 Tax=Paramuricea clavata TaxID=317549 RepID=A0A7D9HZ67_PARCT|nr:Hypothetical predicted protein [Paramuricea clavata]